MLVNITKKIVIVFIIGVLVGAIIATAGFLIFSKTCRSGDTKMAPPSFSQSDSNVLPGINDGNSQGGFNNGGQPPQMPGGNSNGNSNNQQPPQMPNGNTSDGNGGAPELPGNNSSNAS